MRDHDTPPDSPDASATPSTSPTKGPTILEVVCECLGIIEELPPAERELAVLALHNFATCSYGVRVLKCKPRGDL